MRFASWAMVLALLGACGDDGTGDDGGGPPDGGRDSGVPGDGGGGDDTGPPEDAGATVTDITLPADGSEVIHSAAVRVLAPDLATRVRVEVEGMPELMCEATVRRFECLLDVTMLPAGPFRVRAVALDAGGSDLGTDSISLTKRALADPCAGMMGDQVDCVLARVTAGTSAGFEGITYLNYDDTHALLDTSRMTGIDARVLASVGARPPAGAMMGIGNESRACVPMSGGSLSRPRCDLATAAFEHYRANFLVMWPEHRDHGTRDYYQWQAPFYDLSQGSSGSELDEIRKLVIAMAIISPEAREDLRAATVLGPTMEMLLRRARVPTDLAYLTQEAHVTAIGDLDNITTMLTLAAALRAGERPPEVKVTDETMSFPMDWAMRPGLQHEYAISWAPITVPAARPAGRFELTVDLTTSRDPDDDDLIFFPSLLRGDATDVTITRANEEGTRWTIAGSFPADQMIMTGGYMRTVSRVTVGFFAHDGLWLGAPAYVTIGGRPAQEAAPDDNNLD